MPITQDRMLALLTEFKALERSRQELIRDLQWAIAARAKGDFTLEETEASIISTIHLHRPPAFRAFYLEDAHFSREAARNEKKKRYMDGQRRVQGIPQRGGPQGYEGASSPNPFALPTGQAMGTITQHAMPNESLRAAIEQTMAAEPKNTAEPPPPRRLPPGDVVPERGTIQERDTIPDLSEFNPDPPDFSGGVL